MSAIDKAVEAGAAAIPGEGNEHDRWATHYSRIVTGAVVASGHLVPADDPDALLAALVNSGRLVEVPGAVWADRPFPGVYHVSSRRSGDSSLYRLRGSGS